MGKHPLRVMLASMGIALLLLLGTIALGRSPKLGLDLQGGVQVNLQPVKDGEVTDDVTDEQLDQAIGIIRKRVDAIGVAETEVSRQGNTITVQIPGATDQQDVLDLVGKTAELRFRPVLEFLGPAPDDQQREEAAATVARLSGELGLPEGVTAADVVADEQAKQGAATGEVDQGDGATGEIVTEDPATATTAPPTTAAPGTTIDPTSGNGGNSSAGARLQDDSTTTVPPDPTATTVPPTPLNQWGIDVNDERFAELYQAELQINSQLTDPDDDKADATVVLMDGEGNMYRLGPTLLTGRAVEDATSGLNQQGEWVVNPKFRAGADGIDKFNEVATLCYNGDPQCPSGQAGGQGSLGIVLDSEVLTAPTINEPTFARDSIQISGAFDQDSAREVAVALRFGSLPIELEAQQAETVSPTLGAGALRAGIIAGLIGMALAFAYLLIYYRLLAVVALASFTTGAMLLYTAMSWFGATVTLAGIVGLVVSIGVALDSSVLSFEGIKEDVRNGATVRSVAERSMSHSYSTIIKADTSSLIGAAVLYQLSIGPVRGFAFYLGAATLFELTCAYLVLRPGVIALARSSAGQNPKRLGIPVDDLPEAVQSKLVLSGERTA